MNGSIRGADQLSFSLPRGRELLVGRRPLVMGIINITPDSFSDGGAHLDPQDAVRSGLQMEADGASVIDIGGESTRPGSLEVPEAVEIARVVPVIEQLRRRSQVALSIDTRKAAVAEAALDAGADIINDVSALRFDPRMKAVAARCGVPVVLMHMRGEPRTMQQHTRYDDVVTDVARELRACRDEAIAAGIDPGQILVDPGIGFAKTFEQNLELLARCEEIGEVAPLLVGASRKGFIGNLTGRPAGPERMVGSLAAAAAAWRSGAAMVRVHDVRETIDFLKVYSAIAEREK